MGTINDKWNDGTPYEYFMGRWSSLMAPEFIKWLHIPANQSWLDIGCGTGALSEAIQQHCDPQHLSGIDPSEGFIATAKQRIPIKGDFRVASTESLPFDNANFNVTVSGLAMNFFPNLEKALEEMKRVSKPNGQIAAYVWDYAGRMDFLRYFWDAAYQVDPESRKLDEGLRFPICNPDKLTTAFNNADMAEIETSHLDIYTVFKDFDDYWNPFLGGQGPAPSYLAALDEKSKNNLKNNIRERMNFESDGSIKLLCRAIGIKGKCNS